MNPYLTYKNVIVLGGGESGVGAAILAQKHGLNPFLSDKGKINDKYKSELMDKSIAFEDMQHTEAKIQSADLIIKSPGIPTKIPIIQKAIANGAKVVSEIEFASQFTNAKLVGITGTNGKTTTTNLTYHVLKQAGFKVKVAGNIGNSFAREVATDHQQTEYYVLEISSFQLDDIDKLKLHLSVLLNITPDHLDRYQGFEGYIKSKLKITNNQISPDKFIYNIDDENITKHLNEIESAPELIPFSQNQNLDKGAFMNNVDMNVGLGEDFVKFSVEDMLIKGKHNRYNSMAAAIVAKALNVKKEVIRESLANYKNIEHRLEHVAKIKGVDYINDSKATNVNAAWYALESMDNPTVWIAGGVDKGNNYQDLTALAKEKVKAIVCLGVDNEKIVEAFAGVVPQIFETTDIKEAVEIAYKLSAKNDNVLLAPACASFDLFENYADRGDQFKKAVLSL
ncbi:MAG: UDP-N-acetylmuramoyl-L-alanine--D-glutamate ligase [Bacteroidia bacterium]